MINKKIKNATVTQYNGITYRSKMEAKYAKLLAESGISFQYEPEQWTIIPKFSHLGLNFRAVTYTPDFVVGKTAIEVKGWRNDVYPLKKKIIMLYLKYNKPDWNFLEVRNDKDMKDSIVKLNNTSNE